MTENKPVWTKPVQTEILKELILHDDITDQIHETFTIQKEKYHKFKPHVIPDEYIPCDFNIGLIVGASGTGKSLLLQKFGLTPEVKWSDKAIASHFDNYKDMEARLLGVALNSIPIWLAPYKILSTGQKYRADLARMLQSDIIIDEFTSVIDRTTAKSLSNSIQNYIRKSKLSGIVFASPHHDIIKHLKPCWVYDTNTSILTINSEYKKQTIYLDKQYIKIQDTKNTKKIHFIQAEI